MRAAADGVITDEEFSGLLTLGQNMDLIAPGVVEKLFEVQNAALDASGGLETLTAETVGNAQRVGIENDKLGEKLGIVGETSTTTADLYRTNMEEIADSMIDPTEYMTTMALKLENLETKSGKTYVYTFHGVMTGDWPPDSFGGTSAPTPPRGNLPAPDAGLQHGGDFIVPPGYPGDRFTVGVTSGERVTVQTPQQQAEGGLAGTTVNIYAPVTMMVTEEAADILDIE